MVIDAISQTPSKFTQNNKEQPRNTHYTYFLSALPCLHKKCGYFTAKVEKPHCRVKDKEDYHN